MKIIEGIFIGKNNSLGYKTGETYKLNVTKNEKYPVIINRINDLQGYCPYETLDSFFRNWSFIRGYQE